MSEFICNYCVYLFIMCWNRFICWALSFKHGIKSKFLPPFSKKLSLAWIFISSSVSTQSDAKPGHITSKFLIPFFDKSLLNNSFVVSKYSTIFLDGILFWRTFKNYDSFFHLFFFFCLHMIHFFSCTHLGHSCNFHIFPNNVSLFSPTHLSSA